MAAHDATVVSTNGGSERAGYELARRSPRRALAPFVRGELTGFAERSEAPVRRLELPAALVALVVDLSSPMTVTDARGRAASHRGGFVAGLDDAPSVTEHGGESRVVQVNLTPIGARLALSLPMGSIARRVVSLEEALGRDARGLAERLADLPDWASRFDAIEALLLARIERARAVPGWIAAAWERIAAFGAGDSRVARLFDDTGYSRKHVAAAFREHLGLTPKRLQRLVRFERALALLRSGRHRDLASLAFAAGYSDQPHLTREFGAFAGASPARLAAALRAGGMGLVLPG